MSPAERFLEAGPRLAARLPLRSLDAAALCAEAGLDDQALQDAFGDLTGYLCALQERFMDRLRDRMVAVTSGLGPDLRRIQLATETFLERCLAERALRGWLIEARSRPEVAASLRRRNQTYWIIIGAELQTLGWPDAQSAARLFLAMTIEASIVEHRVAQPLAEIREALWDFLRRAGPRKD